jgi:hypothetical protein
MVTLTFNSTTLVRIKGLTNVKIRLLVYLLGTRVIP